MELTIYEKKCFDELVNVWNLFCSLPIYHPDDNIEFKQHIHALQNIILSRPAIRKMNNVE